MMLIINLQYLLYQNFDFNYFFNNNWYIDWSKHWVSELRLVLCGVISLWMTKIWKVQNVICVDSIMSFSSTISNLKNRISRKHTVNLTLVQQRLHSWNRTPLKLKTTQRMVSRGLEYTNIPISNVKRSR